MQKSHTQLRENGPCKMRIHGLRSLCLGGGLGLLHDRINDICLASRLDLLREKAVNALDGLVRHVLGNNRLAPGRQLVNRRNVQITVQRQRERARNWGRRHH